jgi:hypothetical protein
MLGMIVEGLEVPAPPYTGQFLHILVTSKSKLTVTSPRRPLSSWSASLGATAPAFSEGIGAANAEAARARKMEFEKCIVCFWIFVGLECEAD